MTSRPEPRRRGVLAGARVLIVEDEAVVALDLRTIFERAGAEIVGPFYRLAEAVGAAGREAVSVAVLDLSLGRWKGISVARTLAARGIPFFFYTGRMDIGEIRREWPMCPILAKPASEEALIKTAARLLGR